MSNVDNNFAGIRALQLIREQNEKLAQTGGGGHNGGMDNWQQSVENRLGQLHTDIKDLQKFLLLAYGAGFIVLLGVLAKGFGWI